MAISCGDLVVMRVRWHVNANLLGIVLSKDDHSTAVVRCHVIWTTGDNSVRIAWHLEDALMRVDEENVATVRKRCNPGL